MANDDSELLLRALKLGAREFFPPKPSILELDAAIESLFLSLPKTQDRRDAPILAVMGAKGGVGATFVACQLAASLQRRSGSAAIVDLNSPLGDVARAENPLESDVQTPQEKERPTVDTSVTGRVLLAEDGPDNQRLISFFLRKSGFQVTIVDNGLAAYETALEAGRRGNPFDVILMDMQMPVMDGYTATSRLRENEYTGPIIALTAHAMTSDRDKCLAAGCDEFQSKPINRAELIRVIQEQIVAAAEKRHSSV